MAVDDLAVEPDEETLILAAAGSGHHLLFGEIHDNPVAHRWRLGLIEQLLKRGVRPALVFELFDLEQGPALARAVESEVRMGAPEPKRFLAALAAESGTGTPSQRWPWALYEPLLALALRERLPIRAGNLSRTAARAFHATIDGNDPLSALVRWYGAPLPRTVDVRVVEAQAHAVHFGHCRMVAGVDAQRLAIVQMARDATLARSVIAAESVGTPVILMAGSGHTRRDMGVSRWLPPHLPRLSIGVIEHSVSRIDPSLGPVFDVTRIVPAVERADPCAALRR